MRRTAVIGGAAAVTAAGAFVVEFGRVWRRGSAPMPAEADSVVEAAVEAGVETTAVAVAGYQAAPTQENALFNLFASFVISLLASRGIAFALRDRHRFGPFRNVRVGRRHIHHFVPGIALAFISGGIAIVSRDDHLEPRLALVFGTGMGLTIDEAALLLELDDVYWTEEGLLSAQIGFGLAGLLGALAIGLRFLRRGEESVLP
ncbi:MAG: hypothetical protein QOC55_1685 [Thermoleophilaceae bacterium]|jgi:hypothetical protein|nr:hypothetical protein [Thermoleophilaceae bacterium]